MRIKAVLRDGEILSHNPGSDERIIASAIKNIDRIISLTSLLKVMGLRFEERIRMLDVLSKQQIHIWLAKDGQQDIVYIFNNKLPEELDTMGYQWQ